tara:strand:- start:1204 stop:2064 length:861 start_codon:yes stop_codon:yes gene_type:complete
MSEAIFKKIADEAGPHGAYLRISGGGEPMLHPQAVELLVYAKKMGCKIGLITNGSLFNEENSRQLLTAGVDMIEFSVDSSEPSTYDIVRKGLDWETLNINVERMIALRDELDSPTKVIASAVNQEGIDLNEVEKYWVKNKGIDYLIKRKFLTWGTNTELDDNRSADPTAYLEAGEVPCPFIFERLNIDSRGNTMVCGYDISANTSMGNVATESISDIWHGPGFTWYREKHLAGKGADVPLCKGCPDWKYRSWTHNYWKVIENSEKALQIKRSKLGVHDDFQSVAED